MSETPLIAMPDGVRQEYRPWVMGILSAIAAKIGWPSTLTAVDAGLAYYKANPLPAKVKPQKPQEPPQDPAPKPPAVTSLTFSVGPPRGRYVAWSPIVDRTGWGEGPQAGCDGLLYGCKVGGEPKKIEHIPIGRQYTGLKNAYFDAGPKYNQGWRPGDRVLLQIRDARGKLRDPSHQGEWTLR